MRWFLVGDKIYDTPQEDMLYTFLAWRSLVFALPPLETNSNAWTILTYDFPLDADHWKWDAEIPEAEWTDMVNNACERCPQHVMEIQRQAQSDQRLVPLSVRRTGPACPEIVRLTGTYVVREALKRQLDGIVGVRFLSIKTAAFVPLQWELGQPVPDKFRGGEPEAYVKNNLPSEEMKSQMGDFYEALVPERVWHSPEIVPSDTPWTKLAFECFVGSSTEPDATEFQSVELAFESADDISWVRLRSPDGEGPVYELVREDDLEILQEPAKWTLEFAETTEI